MFRYFFVVHAEKGLMVRGKTNSTILKLLFAVFTLAMTVASYTSWPGSVMFDNLWPANTVKGRICLHLRLNWDKDNTKETSDIYIKPRLIVIAMTLTIGLILFHFIRRVYFFVPQICISNRSHASLGGRHRRNLLTFTNPQYLQFLIDCSVIPEAISLTRKHGEIIIQHLFKVT